MIDCCDDHRRGLNVVAQPASDWIERGATNLETRNDAWKQNSRQVGQGIKNACEVDYEQSKGRPFLTRRFAIPRLATDLLKGGISRTQVVGNFGAKVGRFEKHVLQTSGDPREICRNQSFIRGR